MGHMPYEERLRRLGLHFLNLQGDLLAPHNAFSGGLNLDRSPNFVPAVRPGWRGNPFKVLQGPSRRLR